MPAEASSTGSRTAIGRPSDPHGWRCAADQHEKCPLKSVFDVSHVSMQTAANRRNDWPMLSNRRIEGRLVSYADILLEKLAFAQAGDCPVIERSVHLFQEGPGIAVHTLWRSRRSAFGHLLYLLDDWNSELTFSGWGGKGKGQAGRSHWFNPGTTRIGRSPVFTFRHRKVKSPIRGSGSDAVVRSDGGTEIGAPRLR